MVTLHIGVYQHIGVPTVHLVFVEVGAHVFPFQNRHKATRVHLATRLLRCSFCIHQVDGYHIVGTHASCHIDGQVVEQASIDQQHRVLFHRCECQRHRHAGADGLCHVAAVECHFAEVPHVHRHAAQRDGQRVEGAATSAQQRVELLRESFAAHHSRHTLHLAPRFPARSSHVAEQVDPVLRTVDRVELFCVVAYGIKPRDDGSCRCAHHHIDGDTRSLHGLHCSDGSRSFRSATTHY